MLAHCNPCSQQDQAFKAILHYNTKFETSLGYKRISKKKKKLKAPDYGNGGYEQE